jgi:sterol desaturase/sphingolipid hydroxylase (fatty acid hydroxylase superfamily)
MTLLAQSGATIGAILLAMAVVAWIETVLPLHAGDRSSRSHLPTNMALTFITFGTNLVLNSGLVLTLMALPRLGFGVLNAAPQAGLVELAVVLLGLDFSFYAAHVAMHKIPAFWRCHLVHHSDLVVDVTTTIRQHPGESLIRYAFMAAFAFVLGAGPNAFAVYRTWSALNGLLEHANVRLPMWLDQLLAMVATSPNMHKVHHSRIPKETDTNYGNIFSFWDRIFGTFTAVARGTDINYGLEGFDDAPSQTVMGLLSLPFRGRSEQSRSRVGGSDVAARTELHQSWLR